MPDRWKLRGLHLAILAGFAIGQPLFDVLQRHATFLVSHRFGPADVLLLTFVLGFCVPASGFVLGVLTRLAPRRIGDALYAIVLALLVAATALPPLHGASIDGVLAVVVAVLVAGGVTLLYARSGVVRRYFSWCALGLVVFPTLFLANPSIRSLWIGGEATELPALEIEGDTPVVFLILDEFPIVSILGEDREIDPVRYPHFAALADDSHWFRNASAVAGFTEQAVPAILTGTYPAGDRLPIHDHYPNTLFSLLGGTYAMHVHESVTMLFPPSLVEEDARPEGAVMSAVLADLRIVYLHVLLPPRFTGGLPAVTGNWRDFGRGAPVTSDEPGLREQQEERLERLDEVARRSRVEDALDYIGGITADDPRTLHLLHTLLPHSKWEYAPSGRTYCGKCPPRPGLVENIWSDDDHYVRHGYQRHLMQVALADRILGRLVERLEETGLYDETLLVVTADHGASFWPGSPLRHLANNPHPSDILDVPLFVKLPGQEKGVVSDRHVRTIDIVPTILDRLGVEVPPEMDGSSVFDPDYEPAPVKRARDPEGGFTDFDADPDLKYASLDRKISLFGSGSDGSIYAVREHHWLLGKPLPELEVASDSPWYISTDRTYLEDAGKSAAFAPLYVQGAIDGTGVHEQLSVVAVVGDTIVAVSRAIRTSATRSRFFFMLPEESFGTGTVHLDVLVLDESGDEPRILGGHTRPVGFAQPPLPPGYLTAPPSASP